MKRQYSSIMLFFGFLTIGLDLSYSSIFAEQTKAQKEEEKKEEADEKKDPEAVLADRKKEVADLVGKAYDFVVNEVKNDFKERYAGGNVGGRVSSVEINKFEPQFIEERQKNVHKGLGKLFGKNAISDGLDLHIGVVLAGHQMAGLIGSVGFLQELRNTGLLDITTYLSSSSTASWPVISWLGGGANMMDVDVNKVVEKLVTTYKQIKAGNTGKMSQEFGEKLVEELRLILEDVVLPKFVFGQQLGPVDLASVPLAMTFFANKGKDRYEQFLADLVNTDESGAFDASHPFPIYTAVTDDTDKTEYEFNPNEVRQITNQYSIPAYAFNRIFENGQVPQDTRDKKYQAPEMNLTSLMAMLGSSLFVDLTGLAQFFATTVADKSKLTPKTNLEKYGYKVGRKTLQKVVDVKIKELQKKYNLGDKVSLNALTFVAQIQNPFFKFSGVDATLQNQAILNFMDASFGHGIAAAPLLRKARKLDLLIICNASDMTAKDQSFEKFMQEIRTTVGAEYERVTRASSGEEQVQEGQNPSVELYKATGGYKGPDIIYVNMRKPSTELVAWATKMAEQDTTLYGLLNKEKETIIESDEQLSNKAEKVNSQFEFNPTSYDELTNRARFNLRANYLEIIKDLIGEVIEEKNGFTPEGKTREQYEAQADGHSGMF